MQWHFNISHNNIMKDNTPIGISKIKALPRSNISKIKALTRSKEKQAEKLRNACGEQKIRLLNNQQKKRITKTLKV